MGSEDLVVIHIENYSQTLESVSHKLGKEIIEVLIYELEIILKIAMKQVHVVENFLKAFFNESQYFSQLNIA